jgi:hypothetical protein
MSRPLMLFLALSKKGTLTASECQSAYERHFVAERFFYRVRQMSNTTAMEISRVIRSISPASNSENMLVMQ